MMKSIVSMLSASCVLAFATGAQAITVTQWNFNSSNTTPAIGVGAASVVGGVTSPGFNSGGGSSDLTQPGLGWQTTAYPAQGAADKSAGVRFNVDTTGWVDIAVSWDQRHSNTSSRLAQFQYSTDGVNFTDFGSTFAASSGGDRWYNGRTVSLDSIAGVENNPNFAFRIVSAQDPIAGTYLPSTVTSNYGASGTWRFDMVTVSAAPIPEPETYVMLVLGLMALAGIARRRVQS